MYSSSGAEEQGDDIERVRVAVGTNPSGTVIFTALQTNRILPYSRRGAMPLTLSLHKPVVKTPIVYL